MRKNLLLIYFFLYAVIHTASIMELSSHDQIISINKSVFSLFYKSGDWNTTENELWKLEEVYMQSYMKKDIENLSKYYHYKFVGWPSWSEEPLAKKTVISILSKSEKSEADSFKIIPQKIVLMDSIAIVHYLIDVFKKIEKNKNVSHSYRVIHTWLREAKVWKLLSGMSAAIP